jgi:transposase
MDMWEPFITAVQETIEGAETKICFDRFHVASHFGKALDKVRANEHRQLSAYSAQICRAFRSYPATCFTSC